MTRGHEYEVVIVGAGIAGASLAYFLAERGLGDVLLLEREPRLAVHSTGRSAATLAELDGVATLMRLKVLSAPFFRSPPAGFSEHRLLDPTGVLAVAPAALLSAYEKLAPWWSEIGLEFRLLSPDDVLAQVPAIARDEIAGGVLVPGDGRIDVHEILSSYLRHARAKGAELCTGVEVTGVRVAGGRCRGVETTAGSFDARLVVDAAGAWAGRIARMADASPIPIQPKRRTIFTFAPPPGMPICAWPLVTSDFHSVYFAPEAGDLMLSPMDEVAMEPCDPHPDEATIAAAIERFQTLAPSLAPRSIKRRWSGLRSFAPDRVHVVGEDPRRPGFFWLAGQGGCGIETSPIIGRVAADLIVAGRSDAFDTTLLAPRRFAAV